jgi:antitoxin (DNA-binding transcriptional repressor) of toxin-antitoxin stability system
LMHRAAAGETFHVTRRGKPFVTLSPAKLPLPKTEGREPPPPGIEEA